MSIDGRTVGADSKLACSQLRQMHPVPLEKMDVEQVDVRSNDRQSVVESAIEEEDDLNKALRMSLGANPSECGLSEAEEQLEPQAYEDFISYLFLNILDALSDCLDNKEHLSSQLAPLLRLLLDLIRNSSEGKSKNDRARRFARELSKGISSILSRRSIDGSLPHKSIMALVSCLRAAQLLAFHSDTEAASFFEQFHSDDETRLKSSVEVLCKVHGIPAVRRRSAKGKNKDRRFYVCGKERGQRCNFFKWADDVEAKSHGKYLVSSQMRDIIRTSLWNRPLSDGFTLNAALCELLEQDLFNDTDDEADVLFSMTGPFQEKKLPGDSLTSHYGKVERQSDFDDGVFCSREKLQDTSFDAGSRRVTVQKQLYCLDVRNSGDSTNHLLEGCLGLLPLVADYKTEGATRWFSLLCEIDISSNKTSELRNLARKVLKSLVGKKRTLYHSIRDHFSFGFQLQSLYKNSCPMLEAALLSGQRARVCNPKWATSIKLDWSTLSYGGLIGADELIFGTESPPARLRLIAKVLDGLWSVVKNGGDSWRRFCGQAALPSFHRSSRKPLPDLLAPEEHLRGSPQIVSLFWLGCCLSGSYQVKVLRLIEMALTKVDDARATVSLTQESDGLNLASSLESEEDVVSAISGLHLASPESILLLDDKKLRIEDLAAFVFYFILGGKSAELRRVCLNIATKLASHLCTIDRNRLFEKLFSSRFYEIGVVGKGSIEFMHLLQYLAQNLDSSIPLRDFGQIVLKSFKGQMNAVKYGRSNGDWVLIDSGSKRKFDLSECSYCLQTNTLSSTKLCRQTERRDLTARTSRGAYLEQSKSKQTSAAKVITSSAKKLHPEQVSPYSRFRLDALKIGTASNEFSTFFALKHRVVLSEVYLSVDDPRGRFVKTVDVYYSSGPVADAAELKSDDYASQWQKCVTMAVPRGASRASATIAHPVIAANLKIEYTDFFERPGGSKASDGSLIVHCPRCTRGTNEHIYRI